ncbi:2-iminobutanoate/2-iminopropanoate deaminase [Desulfovibrionales bacterium]
MEIITSDKASKAIGPYSQAVAINGLVFCSGQLGLDPATLKLVEGGVEAQTEQVLTNIAGILTAAGLTSKDIVKSTVFLKDMNDFTTINTVYARYLGEHKPARSTVQVARLPLDALVEIECIAARTA